MQESGADPQRQRAMFRKSGLEDECDYAVIEALFPTMRGIGWYFSKMQ